ncbi:MAG: response regulator transcription factor [Bacteroidota bacterium]
MENIIKILIADDHQMFIDGVKALLRKETKYKIAGEALNGDSALQMLRNAPYDILLTDISMPGMSGVDLTKAVKQEFPHVKVMVLTMFNDREVAEEIMNAEAEGYILKNTGKEELIGALETIIDDGTFYSREVLENMIRKIKKEERVKQEIIELSDRELEVLKLICGEYSSNDIAEKLFISRRTVDTHRQHIYEKTGCKTLVSLIKFAIRNELVEV